MNRSISSVVLAAGSSKRFGVANKLLAEIDGSPVLAHILALLKRLPLEEVVTVISSDEPNVAQLCASKEVRTVVNDNANNGMGTSIAAGVCGLTRQTKGIMIVLGDMPFTREKTYRTLISIFQTAPADSILTPVFRGRRGHPIIFSSFYTNDLCCLTDDEGARRVIAGNPASVSHVLTDDPGVLKDIDVLEDLK